ncbi:MAG TPA: dihydrofolate reductase family protein [Pseudonocardia sp.]
MRKIIEYTLISADGVCSGPQFPRFLDSRDDAYLRDGLGLLLACDAMLMGRTTYDTLAQAWPSRTHPWAQRLNTIRKYVFSSTLERADWTNSTIVRGDVAQEVTRLKHQDGGHLLVFGHGQLTTTLLKHHLLDILDLSIHPLLAGSGKLMFHDGPVIPMTLIATKSFANIVKLTYEPQYE